MRQRRVVAGNGLGTGLGTTIKYVQRAALSPSSRLVLMNKIHARIRSSFFILLLLRQRRIAAGNGLLCKWSW